MPKFAWSDEDYGDFVIDPIRGVVIKYHIRGEMLCAWGKPVLVIKPVGKPKMPFSQVDTPNFRNVYFTGSTIKSAVHVRVVRQGHGEYHYKLKLVYTTFVKSLKQTRA